MLSFKEYLNEAYLIEGGGRRILGVNPLQVDSHREFMRAINPYTDHLVIKQTGSGVKISSKDGELLHVLQSNSKIGPKTAITGLTRIRDHLLMNGLYEPEKNENVGIRSMRAGTSFDQRELEEPEETPKTDDVKGLFSPENTRGSGQVKRRHG